MELKDKRISHLRNLGETRDFAIRTLEGELERGSDFLEVAEITDSQLYRDGGIPNKRVGYVAGICGSRDAKSEGDCGDDVYNLIYFNGLIQMEGLWKHSGGTIYSNSLRNITDYVPLNAK